MHYHTKWIREEGKKLYTFVAFLPFLKLLPLGPPRGLSSYSQRLGIEWWDSLKKENLVSQKLQNFQDFSRRIK